MLNLKPCKPNLHCPLPQPARLPSLLRGTRLRLLSLSLLLRSPLPGFWISAGNSGRRKNRKLVARACQKEEKKGEKRSFLSLEEAGLVEISGLSSHDSFLCRLTISSLNLLRIISEQEGFPIEELNAGRICDWFLKDKLKREQNLGSAVLQWDESEFQI
ncbi:hypothetical protein AXF42_Ash009044 [Apostasia shenzhenica]|uniref:Uncharacterized protein n=1 Tax=Apostasia shenzhenica TaxID=1088818 RepID=A0A2I0ADC1_9ASPA|nr:hypothetical protein AXF42_Ash009044 [Apostasia shenzhenica]